ncbi:MAG: LytTR family DNA-binding domain-containing protein [Lachnospiraceae bacterium]|nr:LytTR family DNA-binding domain-containing protein [Lachnospiraceae bacterium]
MRIAYCEDETAQAELVRAMIGQWAESRQTTAEVILYESAEEFLFKNEAFSYDVVFLDIAMRQMNGVELARAIREKDKKLPIAFLTADRTFAIEGYEVRAVRYLLKPVTMDKLGSLLDELLEECEDDAEDMVCITVGEKGIVRKLAESSICYIEVLGHYTQLHLNDSSAVRIKESLAAVAAELHRKELFVKCHRSFVVNLSYVEKISRTECTLSDGTALPVSRSSYQELNERFIQYYRDMI